MFLGVTTEHSLHEQLQWQAGLYKECMITWNRFEKVYNPKLRQELQCCIQHLDMFGEHSNFYRSR